MKNLTLAGISCLAALILFSCGSSEKTYRLEFKYIPGSVISYQQVSTGTIIAKEHDSIVTNQENSVTSNIVFTVRRVVDDTTWEIQEKSQASYQSLNRLDSTRTDTTQVYPDLVVYIAPSGRIVDFEYTATTAAADNSAYMKEYYRQGTPVFPDRAVPIGYSWTQTYDITVDGSPVQVSTVYTVKGIEVHQGHQCVALGYSGAMVIPFEPNPADSTQKHGVDRMTIEGVMCHAVKDGMTISQSEHWVMKGDRKKLKNGAEIAYTVEADYQVRYDLKAISKQ